MKLTFVLALAQAACVFSMPAANETPQDMEARAQLPQQMESPDTLEKRGKCWYSANPKWKGPLCSNSGWCFMECDRGGRPGTWCWQAYKASGSYIRCSTNSDCKNANVNNGSKCHSGPCEC